MIPPLMRNLTAGKSRHEDGVVRICDLSDLELKKMANKNQALPTGKSPGLSFDWQTYLRR
jgi:hypothetical protein